jgi:hypothetical protein
MDVGDVTINRGGENASAGISLLPPKSNCTLLGGALEMLQYASLENGLGVVFDFRGGAHR